MRRRALAMGIEMDWTRKPRVWARPWTAGALACGVLLGAAVPVAGQSVRYEHNLLRLSEILGAMHHLQQLCGRYDDQTWRDQMIALMNVEAAEGVRKKQLTSTFNRGYNAHQVLFTSCTRAADQRIDMFVSEGSQLTTWLSNNRQ